MANTSCFDYVVNTLHEKTCDVSLCNQIQSNIDERCHAKGWTPGEPYIVYKEDGSVCYCCCSCFGYDTPIQIGERAYKLIQNFEKGDVVLGASVVSGATGLQLTWSDEAVEFSGGVSPNNESKFMVYVRYGDPSAVEYNDMIVTEDHLFLNEKGKLTPANALRENDLLIRPDGSTVPVIMVVSGSYLGGVHHISTGEYTPGNLDGHLINSNEVVTADFSLQSAYTIGMIDSSMLVSDLDERPRVGTRAHIEMTTSNAAAIFMGDPNNWPKGFKVTSERQMINIPIYANRFVTIKQAKAIENGNQGTNSVTSNAVMENISYVFRQFAGFYDSPIYIYDWNNDTPNAYAWWEQTQQMVVITGGLARQIPIAAEGLGLIVSHLLDSLDKSDKEHKALVCKGLADYDGTGNFFGNVFRNKSYIESYQRGISQLEEFFNLIPEDLRGGNPKNRCHDPSIECRIACFNAAVQLKDIPVCADPNGETFELNGAIADDDKITIEFSRNVNKATAETVANYTLEPAAEITDASMSEGSAAEVVLTAVLENDTIYVLTVDNVVSVFGESLERGKNKAIFRTNA